MLLLHNVGALPRQTIKMLPWRTDMMLRKMRSLVKEGVLVNNKDIYIINIRDENKWYYEELPDGYKDYYEKYLAPNRKRVSGTEVERDKITKDVEAYIMAYSSGLASMMHEKKDISSARNKIVRGDRGYYTSREIKILSSKTEHSKYDGSRLNGCIIGESGMYPVYNIGSGALLWNKATEGKLKIFLTNIGRKLYVSKMDITTKIIMYRNISALEHLLKNRREGNAKYLSVDFLYEYMLAIPFTDEGKILLDMISREGWRERILSDFIPTEQQSRYKGVSVACDGIEETETGNCYILLYCIPDINKLKLFSERANLENDKSKFKVLCFEDQLPFIAKRLGNAAQIYSIDIKEYYKLFIQEYNNYMSQL